MSGFKDEAIVGSDDEWTQRAFGGFDAQGFECGHTDSTQQQVVAVECLQAAHKDAQLVGQQFGTIVFV